MTFEPGARKAPERILVYGSFKTGKSFSWLDIADTYYQSGNTDVTFYVVDTDWGVPKMLDEGFGHIEPMLKVYHPNGFGGLLEASYEIQANAGPGDWVVIDMLSYAWNEAQRYYIDQVYGEKPENYFTEMRRELREKKKTTGKGDKRDYGGHEGLDWGFITKIYKEFETPLTLPGAAWNTFGATEERKLDPDRGDDPDKLKMFKVANLMAPVGQKGIGHRFDTVLRMTKRVSGQHQIVMVGDRGRENRVWAEKDTRTLDINEPPGAFARAYLMDIAGWTDGQEANEVAPRAKKSKKSGGKTTKKAKKGSVVKKSKSGGRRKR